MADVSPASPEDTPLHFFTAWFCPFAQRARIALNAKGQGLTLVHICAQLTPFLSRKPAKLPPPHGTQSAHVELKRGRVYAPATGVPFEEVECDIYYPDEGRGLYSLTSELNLRTFGNTSLSLELNLSTLGTHPRFSSGSSGDKVSYS